MMAWMRVYAWSTWFVHIYTVDILIKKSSNYFHCLRNVGYSMQMHIYTHTCAMLGCSDLYCTFNLRVDVQARR